MIIRERSNEFIMIKQHDHAQISATLYQKLHEKFLPRKEYRSTINYAISQHDCGWIPFDEAPFWNDEASEPYSFTNFPTEAKTVLYEYGINQVEETDPYATLLCSEHYTRFLKKSTDKTSVEFVQSEQSRQKRILNQLNIARDQWMAHYEILQFFDNLSLFICLNEPSITQEEEHYFFRKGISLPSSFNENELLHPKWVEEDEIYLNIDLFTMDVAIPLKQKIVRKQAIADNGLLKAYQQAKTEEKIIKFVYKN